MDNPYINAAGEFWSRAYGCGNGAFPDEIVLNFNNPTHRTALIALHGSCAETIPELAEAISFRLSMIRATRGLDVHRLGTGVADQAAIDPNTKGLRLKLWAWNYRRRLPEGYGDNYSGTVVALTKDIAMTLVEELVDRAGIILGHGRKFRNEDWGISPIMEQVQSDADDHIAEAGKMVPDANPATEDADEDVGDISAQDELTRAIASLFDNDRPVSDGVDRVVQAIMGATSDDVNESFIDLLGVADRKFATKLNVAELAMTVDGHGKDLDELHSRIFHLRQIVAKNLGNIDPEGVPEQAADDIDRALYAFSVKCQEHGLWLSATCGPGDTGPWQVRTWRHSSGRIVDHVEGEKTCTLVQAIKDMRDKMSLEDKRHHGPLRPVTC